MLNISLATVHTQVHTQLYNNFYVMNLILDVQHLDKHVATAATDNGGSNSDAAAGAAAAVARLHRCHCYTVICYTRVCTHRCTAVTEDQTAMLQSQPGTAAAEATSDILW